MHTALSQDYVQARTTFINEDIRNSDRNYLDLSPTAKWVLTVSTGYSEGVANNDSYNQRNTFACQWCVTAASLLRMDSSVMK
jgi:hypothetical protein